MESREEHITNVWLISVIMYGVGEVFNMWFCFPCAIPNNKVKITISEFYTQPFQKVPFFVLVICLCRKHNKLISGTF